MADALANLGYMMMKKEATKGSAVYPNVAVPLYTESLVTNVNYDIDNPIVGLRDAVYQVLKGQRDHQGEIKVLAEAKSAPHFFNMLIKKGTSTGPVSGAYTHPYTLGEPVNSYTIDFNKDGIVYRFLGCELSNISPSFEDNKMTFEAKITALHQFSVAAIASNTANTLTLSTEYDPSPTTGITDDDTLTLVDVSAGTSESVAVTSITSGTIVAMGAIAGTYGAGDYCYLKQQTPTYTLVEPFNWARTEFRFGINAVEALTNPATALEKGSSWNVKHDMNEETGELRSGSYDPSVILRNQGQVEFDIKKFFDSPAEQYKFHNRVKRSCVIRHFSNLIGGSTYYELRITLNNLKAIENPANLNTGEQIYYEQKFVAQYDSSDLQAFDVKIINASLGTDY